MLITQLEKNNIDNSVFVSFFKLKKPVFIIFKDKKKYHFICAHVYVIKQMIKSKYLCKCVRLQSSRHYQARVNDK